VRKHLRVSSLHEPHTFGRYAPSGGAISPRAPRKYQVFQPGIFLVRHIDLSWNTLEPSLILMYEKLANLGWAYYNGEIHIAEPKTEESYYHTH